MAVNKRLKKSGYYGSATSNGKKLMSALTQQVKQLDSLGELLLEEICKLFVDRARQRLVESGYDVGHLTGNIYYRKYGKGKYRIGIKNNSQKEIMYFLEFGTGVVGEDNPHEMADDIGWQYGIGTNIEDYNSDNEFPTGWNSLGEFVGWRGWFYKGGRFTSGLKAVSYIYDTLNNDMEEILEEAKRRVYGTI